MNKTKIEYLDWTWNPIAMRCTPVSDGCRNCWHLAMAKRLEKNPMIPEYQRQAYAGGQAALSDKELEAPYKLKKSARIGVQFMGDLFHQGVPSFWMALVIKQMHRCPQHSFFVLTKRIKRAALIEELDWYKRPSNLWLGVSVENQQTADERIPILLQIPAAKRFVSCEPLLNEIDLIKASECNYPNEMRKLGIGIDWCIVGGETGPKARPLHPDWIRSIRDQCQAAGVSFFFKGWGEYLHESQVPLGKANECIKASTLGNKFGDHFFRIGHLKAGRLLDGREWNEMPK